MDSCNFTGKANSHAFEVEINTRKKLCHFGHYDARAKLFCQKGFVPVTGLECSYVNIFSYEHIKFFTKERVARRDLGNRASPVDRAHMKTP